MNKLLFSFLLINSLTLFCSEQEPAQHVVIKLDAIRTLEDVKQYESQCYQRDYYAFHPHDLPQKTSSSSLTTNSSAVAPTKKSLYAQFNDLPHELQDYITGYLKKTKFSNTKDSALGLFVMIDDIAWKEEHKKQFKTALKSWLPKDLPFIKDCLRTEYFLLHVARACNEHPMTANNRMVPSELCPPEHNWFSNNILDNPCNSKYPQHDLEIAALMIHCGALVNLKNGSYTPLCWAIERDNIPMIKLLMQNDLIQIHVSQGLSHHTTPLHVAAESNALNAIRYLHSIGHDLNAKEANGHTPLRKAHFYEHGQAVQLLLSLGANPNMNGIKITDGYTKSIIPRFNRRTSSLWPFI